MTWRYDKETEDFVFSGFQEGIAPSPHNGIANLKNVNIATETGEVMTSFGRVKQTQTNSSATGTILPNNSSAVDAGAVIRTAGIWITISASTISGLSTGNYYVLTYSSASNTVTLASYYNGAQITGFGGTGTATYSLIRNFGLPIASATEPYFSSSQQYRYYILDSQGLVWVYDTATANTATNYTWFLPDTSITYFGSDTAPSGIGVLNGWLMVFSGNKIWVKKTVDLGGTTSTTSLWVQMTNAILSNLSNTTVPHAVLVGHQGSLLYTDGNYVGKIFPDTSLKTGAANIQSYAKYTASTTTGTISTLIAGSIPWTADNSGTVVRIPAVFFTDQAGTQPTNLSANTVYYIQYAVATGNFQVYAALTGGSAIDIASGAAGNQYFNTFFVVGTHAGAYGDTSTCTFTPQRLNLPYFEVGQSIGEIGNTVIIGCYGNTVYPWNQIDTTPSLPIALPESGVPNMVNVNNMMYMLVGNKGNIYITDGSVASKALTVPDYCAGIAGSPATYIEPYFTWGGIMYLRGRVYFSILDQTSTKAGNCGGVWSFVPSQNIAADDDGTSLRIENISSYGTYSGLSTVLIPYHNQVAISPQYWSAWYSSISSPAYGIDFTDTKPTVVGIVETDALRTGTMLDKHSFKNQEYKLASPLLSGETVQLYFRLNLTDDWTSCGTVIAETNSLSGYFQSAFQNTQWLQLKAELTPNGTATFSGNRLVEIRLR